MILNECEWCGAPISGEGSYSNGCAEECYRGGIDRCPNCGDYLREQSLVEQVVAFLCDACMGV